MYVGAETDTLDNTGAVTETVDSSGIRCVDNVNAVLLYYHNELCVSHMNA